MNLPPNADPKPRARRSAPILANAVTIAALLALLAGCQPQHATADRASAEPVEIAMATFHPGGSGAGVVLPGRVKAAEEVTLTARIAARLTALPAREGRSVRQGDPVALFAAPEMQRALAAARADVASAELTLSVASRQQARMESLYVARVIADRDREVAADARRAAEARLEAASAALDALASGSTVRAPFDGVVVSVHADPGADLAAGSPLVDLRSSAGLEVVVDVPEDALDRLDASTLTVQIGDGPWRPARLSRLEGMTDWRSRSRTAHLAFDGGAEPGAYARVALSGRPGDPEAGSVPVASLVSRGALSGVFVIEDGQARLRWLKLGRTQADRVEVLAGLEPGERFALTPRSLADGQAVRVRS